MAAICNELSKHSTEVVFIHVQVVDLKIEWVYLKMCNYTLVSEWKNEWSIDVIELSHSKSSMFLGGATH